MYVVYISRSTERSMGQYCLEKIEGGRTLGNIKDTSDYQFEWKGEATNCKDEDRVAILQKRNCEACTKC